MAASAAAAAKEELTLKKRLLTGTSSTRANVDPPLKKLTKRYMAFAAQAAKGAGADPAELDKLREAVLRELALYEFGVGRTAGALSAAEREREDYKAAHAELDAQIARAHGEIEQLKVELKGAQTERHQQEEYEALRRLCMQHPSRAATASEVAALEAELRELEREDEQTAQALALRKKQFALLLTTIDDLACTLADDKAKEQREDAMDVDA